MARYTVEHIQPDSYYRINDSVKKMHIASTVIPSVAEEICGALNKVEKEKKKKAAKARNT
jgi:hypothetical protein